MKQVLTKCRSKEYGYGTTEAEAIKDLGDNYETV